MTEERFKQLLQEADRGVLPRGAPADFAERIAARGVRVRRRRRYMASAGAAVILLCLICGRMFDLREEAALPSPEAAVRDLRGVGETESLRIQVEAQQAVLDALLAREQEKREIAELRAKVAALERKLASMPDAAAEVQEQREKAANAILRLADRRYEEPDSKESAAAEYQNLLQLFPETAAARKAKSKLSNLKPQGKGDVL